MHEQPVRALPAYVLVTPAHNEEAFLAATVESIAAQTARPLRWVIVSDGSTDRTGAIAQAAAHQHDWIEAVIRPRRTQRDFAGKVRAFDAGLDRLRGLDYEIVGNVDADTTFEPDYFAFVLRRFAENPRLGVGGTPVIEGGATYDFRFASELHVSGPCQLFRRACFEDIGGYQPIKRGAIDWVAVTTARMKGWETRSFMGKTYMHHRQMGTQGAGVLRSRFRYGQKDYTVGGHPLWEVSRAVYHMKQPPYVIGGVCLLAGYTWAAIRRMERPISPELMQFHRAEQMARLRALLRRWRGGKPNAASTTAVNSVAHAERRHD